MIWDLLKLETLFRNLLELPILEVRKRVHTVLRRELYKSDPVQCREGVEHFHRHSRFLSEIAFDAHCESTTPISVFGRTFLDSLISTSYYESIPAIETS